MLILSSSATRGDKDGALNLGKDSLNNLTSGTGRIVISAQSTALGFLRGPYE